MGTEQIKRPLDGIRVLEVGQLLAGPFAGSILGYFGAEVIKVESPGSGDPLRQWRELDEDGTSFWWRSLGRNKKCVTANTYCCADGKFVIIGANGDSIFRRLCEVMDRPDMALDPRFASNAKRVEHEAEIDAVISAWMEPQGSATALERLERARVPAGPIYSVADMMADEHFRFRGLFEEVDVNGKPLKVPAIMPKLSETPGRTDWAGPEVGAFNDEIYRGVLGLSAQDYGPVERKGRDLGKLLLIRFPSFRRFIFRLSGERRNPVTAETNYSLDED